MFKKLYLVLAVLLVATMLFTACAPAATEAPVEVEEPEVEEEVAEPTGKICQVTDAGGIDDKSFNATAWKGVQAAMEDLGVEGKYLESQQQTDYEKNINAFLEEGCDLIVTVGFLLGDATAAAAEANPDQKFAIVDYGYDPIIPNVLGLTYQTDEAAFLAGYLAAGMTETGKVGTFGGIQIPTVTIFMDGFYKGVMYYNEEKFSNVEVLGWDPATQTGLFAGNFESTDDGRRLGEALMDEGADIIMPVAGPVGLGTAAAVQDRGTGYVIGVDDDWTMTAPDYADIVLTSVMKLMNQSVFDVSKQVLDDSFAGGFFTGTLENGGVGLGTNNEAVPAELLSEVAAVQADIITGDISVSGEAVTAELPDGTGSKICQVTDAGGIDDKSFNATAWKGVQAAMEAMNVEGKYLESQQQTDYEKNINAFLEEGCDMIVTVGFLLGDATAAAAEANPDQKFAIVDFGYDPIISNVLGLTYQTDEAAFLAGYLAAGTTATGKVGTFGGIQIPTVTIFMDGFYYGVMYYNEVNGTSVEVLGWDPVEQTGLFAGNFESTDDGRRLGEALMDEGADIIMPVAGPVGLGTAAAVQDRGTGYVIGVDDDWTVTAPDYADIVLTSVMKLMDASVFDATQQVLDGTFKGGFYTGTLRNGGVGLGTVSEMADAALVSDVEKVRAEIIFGLVDVAP